MSTKRKRLIETVGNTTPLVGTPVKKRKGRCSLAEKNRINEELKKARGVFNVLKQSRGEENREVIEHFLRTPSRRTEPEYYKCVKSPIDLTRIQQKLQTEEYINFDQFCSDVELLVENSKSYYKEESEEYQDALVLLKIYKDAKERIENGLPLIIENNDNDDLESNPSSSIDARSISSGRASRASTASEDEIEPIIVDDLLCGILEYTDSTGRLISPPFRVLQSREEFPLYYEKIKNPIDLKQIAEKGRAGKYKYMAEIEADVRLLCKNAQQFAGKGTEIYKDAALLVEYFKEKRDQIIEKGVHNKRREKITRVVDTLLAQSVSSEANDLYSEDSEEDEDSETSDDPKWQLYWALRNEPDEKDKGTYLADPFLELPSRTCYPDYYDDIKNPMSFYMINKKLKRNDYKVLSDLVEDCMKIYENACEYNIEGSTYFIAAKKLEQLTLNKARELQPSIDLSLFDKKQVVKPKPAPKPKTPKTPARPIPADDSSSDEKDTPPPTQKKPRSPRKQRPISTGMSLDLINPSKPGRKSMDELMLRFRQQLMSLWEIVYNFKDLNLYWPAGAFVELPSRKEYPDYFDVIANPIDMNMIKEKIENNKYETSPQMLEDFKTMFNNCREFNEPGSDLARDATRLEELIMKAHADRKDAPYESPVYMKNKYGWLKTKLPMNKRARMSAAAQQAHQERHQASLNGFNGTLSPSNFSLSNGYCGISDDELSYSSVRSPSATPRSKGGSKTADRKLEDMINRLPPDQQRMWRLFTFIKDYRDEDGRKLATAFLKLPTREEYPNYYEVIKKPMDLQRIQQRLNGQGYASWSDLVADMTLMLDNACKYNETDSSIYKDAVSLQRVLLEKKMELGASDDSMPRVQVEIRSMFTNIFAAVFGKKDDDGRCRSDSFTELPDILKAKGIPEDDWPFSFDQIKRNIEKCRYRRLDRFQKDFFDLFEKAREHAKVGSKLYEDATALQLVFIKERDTHCKGALISDAYAFIEADVLKDAELLTKQRMAAGEVQELERRESTDEIAMQDGEVDLESYVSNGVTYTVPSYVYVARTDDNAKGLPHIMRIERIYKNDSGDNMVKGFWVYRPSETLHLPNRRFLEKEVFITPFQDVVLCDRLLGKCQVVSLKTHLANTVEGFDEKDVYVCESKYLGKPRYFVKAKVWMYPEEEAALKLEPRERPISPVRVASEFIKAELEDHSSMTSSSSEDDDRLREHVFLDIDRPEVSVKGDPDADGRMYFTQMRTKCGKHYAVGDYILVFNPEKPYCDVMRIDKLWRDNNNSEWFSGGWFARPSDIKHDKGRMFYRREVFAVNQPDQTRRVDDIQQHCSVMLSKEYVKERPTEIPECDVFVCESRVNGMAMSKGETSSLFPKASTANAEENDQIPDGEAMHIDFAARVRRLKTYKTESSVVDAELFRFKTPITMEKEMSPLLKNDIAVPLDPLDMDMLDENDTDGTESVASTNKPELNAWLASQPKLTAKSKSGYILFSAEIRKRIMHENPEAGFGEVSKIVGIEWKKLSDEQKRQYEVRAEYIARERAKQEAQRTLLREQLQPGQMRIYQCRWSNCDSQFDHENGLYEHIVQHHTSQIILDSENQYVCMWVTCLRNRKDGKPFPSLPRLHRHMKEKHLGTASRSVYPNQLGRNFFKLITTPTSNGDNLQLVHCPHGRGAGGVPPQNGPSTPHAGGHMNGHHTPQVNGGSSDAGHFSTPNPPHGHHQTHPQGMYVPQPSSSHYHAGGQQMPPPSHHAQQQQHHHHGHQQQHHAGDPGRMVVKLPPGAEPVFVHAPASFMSRRVLHSDTYLKYIESLGSNRQRTVSNYDRSLLANRRNTQQATKRPLPTHWIRQFNGRDAASEDDVIKALWKMRDQILESTTGISSEREFTGQL